MVVTPDIFNHGWLPYSSCKLKPDSSPIQRVRKQAFLKRFCFVTSKRQALVFLDVTPNPISMPHLQNKTSKKNLAFFKKSRQNDLKVAIKSS